MLEATGIRILRARPVFTTPNVFPPDHEAGATTDEHEARVGHRRVDDERHCYVCKDHYTAVHHFYDQLCPPCAARNHAKRTETADLSGRVALLTGGRVKIGYQAGIKLLRAGASLIVTTRFPRDAAARYAAEPDAAEWSDRLEVFGLDLRHTPSVEELCRHLRATRDRLDFVVNNACQTVRRPPDFYAHMLEAEVAAGQEHGPGGPALCWATTTACGASTSSTTGLRPSAPAVTHLDAAARAALASQARLLPEDHAVGGHLFPGGPARPGPPAGRPSGPELVAPHPGRGVDRRAAGDPAGQRGGALRAQRPAEAADAAHARARQAHRQRLRRRGPVLPPLQDHPAPPHQHGQGRAQHDDPDLGGGLPRRRHPHEQRRHRLGERRGPGRASPRRSGPSTASTRPSTSSTARPASSTPSSTASTPAPTGGASS